MRHTLEHLILDFMRYIGFFAATNPLTLRSHLLVTTSADGSFHYAPDGHIVVALLDVQGIQQMYIASSGSSLPSPSVLAVGVGAEN